MVPTQYEAISDNLPKEVDWSVNEGNELLRVRLISGVVFSPYPGSSDRQSHTPESVQARLTPCMNSLLISCLVQWLQPITSHQSQHYDVSIVSVHCRAGRAQPACVVADVQDCGLQRHLTNWPLYLNYSLHCYHVMSPGTHTALTLWNV